MSIDILKEKNELKEHKENSTYEDFKQGKFRKVLADFNLKFIFEMDKSKDELIGIRVRRECNIFKDIRGKQDEIVEEINQMVDRVAEIIGKEWLKIVSKGEIDLHDSDETVLDLVSDTDISGGKNEK